MSEKHLGEKGLSGGFSVVGIVAFVVVALVVGTVAYYRYARLSAPKPAPAEAEKSQIAAEPAPHKTITNRKESRLLPKTTRDIRQLYFVYVKSDKTRSVLYLADPDPRMFTRIPLDSRENRSDSLYYYHKNDNYVAICSTREGAERVPLSWESKEYSVPTVVADIDYLVSLDGKKIQNLLAPHTPCGSLLSPDRTKVAIYPREGETKFVTVKDISLGKEIVVPFVPRGTSRSAILIPAGWSPDNMSVYYRAYEPQKFLFQPNIQSALDESPTLGLYVLSLQTLELKEYELLNELHIPRFSLYPEEGILLGANGENKIFVVDLRSKSYEVIGVSGSVAYARLSPDNRFIDIDIYSVGNLILDLEEKGFNPQPFEYYRDNDFHPKTYSKYAGVITMFEGLEGNPDVSYLFSDWYLKQR